MSIEDVERMSDMMIKASDLRARGDNVGFTTVIQQIMDIGKTLGSALERRGIREEAERKYGEETERTERRYGEEKERWKKAEKGRELERMIAYDKYAEDKLKSVSSEWTIPQKHIFSEWFNFNSRLIQEGKDPKPFNDYLVLSGQQEYWNKLKKMEEEGMKKGGKLDQIATELSNTAKQYGIAWGIGKPVTKELPLTFIEKEKEKKPHPSLEKVIKAIREREEEELKRKELEKKEKPVPEKERKAETIRTGIRKLLEKTIPALIKDYRTPKEDRDILEKYTKKLVEVEPILYTKSKEAEHIYYLIEEEVERISQKRAKRYPGRMPIEGGLRTLMPPIE